MAVTTRSRAAEAASEQLKIDKRLSWWARLYIYALHGVTMEVLYTAIWEITRMNFKAIGFSSIWAVFMYAVGLFGIEQLFLRYAWKFHVVIRGLMYAAWIYLVEFTFGFLLEVFDAKPWDYKLFAMNFNGLVTLEYAPMWFILGLATEAIVVKIVLNTSYSPIQDGHRHAAPAHAVSLSHKSLFLFVPAFVALLAYIQFVLVASYNDGEFNRKNDANRSAN